MSDAKGWRTFAQGDPPLNTPIWVYFLGPELGKGSVELTQWYGARNDDHEARPAHSTGEYRLSTHWKPCIVPRAPGL